MSTSLSPHHFRMLSLLFLGAILLAGCSEGGGGATISGGGVAGEIGLPPVIALVGDDPYTIILGSVYKEPGVTITDDEDTNLKVIATGAIDTDTLGVYTRTYNVTDSDGNAAVPVTRSVKVVLAAPSPNLTVGQKELRFFWSPIAGADHYRILVNPDGVSGFEVDPSATDIRVDSHNAHNLSIAVHKTDWLSAQYIVEACDANEIGCNGSAVLTLSPADSIAAIGYIKAFNTNEYDDFGHSIAVSGDGNTLVVGAPSEDGNGSTKWDNNAVVSGAVYVFTRSGAAWKQQAYLKASLIEGGDRFGSVVSISNDGNTLAVGTYAEDSAAKGVNGDQASNAAVSSGAVYMFQRTGSDWTQQAYLKASNTETGDSFGWSVSLSGDGNTLAVGAPQEDSGATGIDGDQNNIKENSNDVKTADTGAVYVFTRTGASWAQQAYVKASNTDRDDRFGSSLSLSEDGSTLAVGASREDSGATGVDGVQTDNSAGSAGAVYVFGRTGVNWVQNTYIKASNTAPGDEFGSVVSINNDGKALAVGASNSGAVYLFGYKGSSWKENTYIKVSNSDAGDRFGSSVSLSGDASTLAVGAYQEDSSAVGVGGDPADNSSSAAGAVYVFALEGPQWTQKGYVKASNAEAGDLFGSSVALNSDGNTLAVAAPGEDSAEDLLVAGDQADNSAPEAGAVYIY